MNRGGSDNIEGGTSVTLSTENGFYAFHYDLQTTRWSVAEHDAPAPLTLHRARLEGSASSTQTIQNVTSSPFRSLVELSSETYDDGGIGDPSASNYKIVIAQAGFYLINGGVCILNNAHVEAQLFVNDALVQRAVSNTSGATAGNFCPNATTLRNLAVNDKVQLYAAQNGTGTATDTTAGNRPFLEVIQLPTSAVAGVGITDIFDADNDTKIQAEETADEDKIRFDTAGSERMIIDANGRVGIGTSNPAAPLDVAGTIHAVTLGVSGNATFSIDDAITSAVVDVVKVEHTTTGTAAAGLGAGQVFYVEDAGGTEEQSSIDVSLSDVTDGSEDADMVFSVNANGTITEFMRLDGSAGTAASTGSPTASLVVAGGIQARGGAPGDNGANNNGYSFAGGSGDNDSGMFSLTDGQLSFYLSNVHQLLIRNDGLHIPSGDAYLTDLLDLAENFRTADNTLAPGEIVTFDPSNPSAYIVRASSAAIPILGVISTAPGVVLGEPFPPGDLDKSLRPVALSGRVPVKVNTENGDIVPGDSLTISSQPGVAMKANDGDQAIGYALGSYLGSGIGSIQVFVSLDRGTQKLREQIQQLKEENDAMKQLVCADHGDAEICQEASTFSASDILPGPEHAGKAALWVFGSIGAVLAALGAVFLLTSRSRAETTV